MSEKGLPSLLERHWAESALAIGAVIIAAVSLWVAYDTERTNLQLVASERRLVAANSWPFVQISENDALPGGGPGMTLMLANQGIGPAKIETFELFWRGQPQRSIRDLVRQCCEGQGDPRQSHPASTADLFAGYGATHGLVLRPGQLQYFEVLARTTSDAAIFDKFQSEMNNVSFRYCYCSAFNDCWLVVKQYGKSEPATLNPPPVRACPRPQVSYFH